MGDNERIAKVEAAISSIEKGLGRLEDKLDNLLESIEKRFLPRNEYSETVKRLEARLNDHEEELKELKSKSSKVPVWAASLITFLLTLIGWFVQLHIKQ